MRMRIAPRVTSAAVPAVNSTVSPRAPRVRSGNAAAADLLISSNIRILVYTIRTVTEIATIAVRIFYIGGSYTNDL
jgi:hypothetical protein